MYAAFLFWPVGMITGGLAYAAGVRRRSRRWRIAGVVLMFAPLLVLLAAGIFFGPFGD